jgi:hypothetical protein
MSDYTVTAEDGTPVRIHVAPPATGWQPEYPCGCGIEHGVCDRHRPLLHTIHLVWRHGNAAARALIWSLADGYGPEQAETPYDWSGVRDSTPAALEAIAAALEAL